MKSTFPARAPMPKGLLAALASLAAAAGYRPPEAILGRLEGADPVDWGKPWWVDK